MKTSCHRYLCISFCIVVVSVLTISPAWSQEDDAEWAESAETPESEAPEEDDTEWAESAETPESEAPEEDDTEWAETPESAETAPEEAPETTRPTGPMDTEIPREYETIPLRKTQPTPADSAGSDSGFSTPPRGARDRAFYLSFGRVLGSIGSEKYDSDKYRVNGMEAFLYILSSINVEFLPISYLGIEALVQPTAYRRNDRSYADGQLGFTGYFCLSVGLLVSAHPIKEHWFDPYIGAGVKLATYWYSWEEGVKDFSPGAMMKLGGNFFVTSWFFVGLNYEFSYNKFDAVDTSSTETTSGYSSTETTPTTSTYMGFRLIDNRFNLMIGFAF